MPILNYTTSISAEKTIGEIQKLLQKAGAQAIMTEFDEGIVSSISFRMMTPHGLIAFRLPCNTQGVFKALKQEAQPRYQTKEQASRVAWRIVKDWVEVQIAMLDAEQADTVELFLPFAQDNAGVTVYERLKKSDFKMLTHQE
jgi:hypothetical protein